jgi:hypothetical protein
MFFSFALRILPLVSIVFLVSCATRYGVGNLGSASRYLSKPMSSDSCEGQHYATGAYYFNDGNGYYTGERSHFGELFYHYGVARKHYVFAAGGGLYLGRYQVREWQQAPGTYAFYGGNLTFELAPNLVFGEDRSRIFRKLEWRALGIRATSSFEDGPFARFRAAQDTLPGFENLNKRLFFHHLGLTSELQFELRRLKMGFFGSVGLSFDSDNFRASFISAGVSLTHSRISLINQFHAGSRQRSNFSAGLTYRF